MIEGGDYDVLLDGNYPIRFTIIGGFNNVVFYSIPHLLVYQNGIIVHSENIITFNTLMQELDTTSNLTSSGNLLSSSDQTTINPLPVSFSYLYILVLPILLKGKKQVHTLMMFV